MPFLVRRLVKTSNFTGEVNFHLKEEKSEKKGDPAIFTDVSHMVGVRYLSSTVRQVDLGVCLETSIGFPLSISVGVFEAWERKRLSDL